MLSLSSERSGALRGPRGAPTCWTSERSVAPHGPQTSAPCARQAEPLSSRADRLVPHAKSAKPLQEPGLRARVEGYWRHVILDPLAAIGMLCNPGSPRLSSAPAAAFPPPPAILTASCLIIPPFSPCHLAFIPDSASIGQPRE